MRQIVLDTETTGLEPSQGHRIIEIGCVELVNRRLTGNRYHQYLQPDRKIDDGAIEVHGITNEELVDKPRFADVKDDFLDFIRGSELIIHNAPFDVGFLDKELSLLGKTQGKISDFCSVLDTLEMARKIHPGQRNNLDALCKRYDVDNSQRDVHGALLDAELLAEVYLAFTGGQTNLSLDSDSLAGGGGSRIRKVKLKSGSIKVIRATKSELKAHIQRLDDIDQSSNGACVWKLMSDVGSSGK